MHLAKDLSMIGKVRVYKIKTQKFVIHLHTKNKRPEREIKETISSTHEKETNMQEYKNKTMIKEIKDYTNRWEDIPHSWFERINTVKMTILHKSIYKDWMQFLPNYQWHFFRTKRRENYLYGNTKDLEKQNESGERKMVLEESESLTSDYTTKLQTSKNGTGIKTEIQINGTGYKIHK